jgi:putative lipoprotein
MTRSRAPLTVGLVSALAAGAPGGPARAADADPWFGHDKLLHFEATTSLAVVGYAGASFATDDRRLRVAAGASLAIGVGAAKELWDLDGHGDASWRDFTWDVVGAATGVLVASAVDWLVHRFVTGPANPATRPASGR